MRPFLLNTPLRQATRCTGTRQYTGTPETLVSIPCLTP